MKSTIFNETEIMEIKAITEDYVLLRGTIKKNYNGNPDFVYSNFKKNIGTGKDDQRFLRDCKELGIGAMVVLTTKLRVKGNVDVKD